MEMVRRWKRNQLTAKSGWVTGQVFPQMEPLEQWSMPVGADGNTDLTVAFPLAPCPWCGAYRGWKDGTLCLSQVLGDRPNSLLVSSPV